jgi:hypothetical protein
MRLDWSTLELDGQDRPRWAGDTLPIAVTITSSGAPYTGEITGARCELMRLEDDAAVPLDPPVFKTLGAGIEWAQPDAIIVFQPVDTKDLPSGTYGYAFRAYAADIGEWTLARRLRLRKRPFAIS